MMKLFLEVHATWSASQHQVRPVYMNRAEPERVLDDACVAISEDMQDRNADSPSEFYRVVVSRGGEWVSQVAHGWGNVPLKVWRAASSEVWPLDPRSREEYPSEPAGQFEQIGAIWRHTGGVSISGAAPEPRSLYTAVDFRFVMKDVPEDGRHYRRSYSTKEGRTLSVWIEPWAPFRPEVLRLSHACHRFVSILEIQIGQRAFVTTPHPIGSKPSPEWPEDNIGPIPCSVFQSPSKEERDAANAKWKTMGTLQAGNAMRIIFDVDPKCAVVSGCFIGRMVTPELAAETQRQEDRDTLELLETEEEEDPKKENAIRAARTALQRSLQRNEKKL